MISSVQSHDEGMRYSLLDLTEIDFHRSTRCRQLMQAAGILSVCRFNVINAGLRMSKIRTLVCETVSHQYGIRL